MNASAEFMRDDEYSIGAQGGNPAVPAVPPTRDFLAMSKHFDDMWRGLFQAGTIRQRIPGTRAAGGALQVYDEEELEEGEANWVGRGKGFNRGARRALGRGRGDKRDNRDRAQPQHSDILIRGLSGRSATHGALSALGAREISPGREMV